MRCDKCRETFRNDWIADNSCPKYEITEKIGIGEYAPINLCYDCSIMFRMWLDIDVKDNHSKNKTR